MKAMIQLFLVFIILTFVLASSCRNEDKVKRVLVQQINSKATLAFENLDIEAATNFVFSNNSLLIDIDFVDRYFLTDESNKLIFSYMFYVMDDVVMGFDTITITYHHRGLIGAERMVYPRSDIVYTSNKISENLLFRDMLIFALREFDNNDIVIYDRLIEELRDIYLPGEFVFRGSFWLLLYRYSISCCNPDSDIYKSMDDLINAASYPKATVKPEVLKSLKHKCASACE